MGVLIDWHREFKGSSRDNPRQHSRDNENQPAYFSFHATSLTRVSVPYGDPHPWDVRPCVSGRMARAVDPLGIWGMLVTSEAPRYYENVERSNANEHSFFLVCMDVYEVQEVLEMLP